MSLHASVGVESGSDSFTTAANAAQVALSQLGETPSFALVFASSKYDQGQVLAGVNSVVKNTKIIGSSTAGEITTRGPAKQNSVAVMLLASDSMKFYVGVGEGIKDGAHEAGRKAAEEVKKQSEEPLKAFIMIPDVLVGNGAEIVRGVLEELGAHFPVVGGASGDDFNFKQTYQYCNSRVYSGACVGLGISGSFGMGIGVKHGWIPIGIPKTVTRAVGATVHEIDNKPAINLYEEYFGAERTAALKKESLAKLALTYPIGMHKEGSDEMAIAAPITLNEDGSITCAAEVPQDAEIQLMIGSADDAITVAKIAAANALEQLNGKEPKAIIIFNCIARHKVFGERAPEEIEAIQSVLGTGTPLIGFYTYGEQAPLGGEVRNIEKCNPAFHNETVVILALSE